MVRFMTSCLLLMVMYKLNKFDGHRLLIVEAHI